MNAATTYSKEQTAYKAAFMQYTAVKNEERRALEAAGDNREARMEARNRFGAELMTLKDALTVAEDNLLLWAEKKIAKKFPAKAQTIWMVTRMALNPETATSLKARRELIAEAARLI